MPFKKGALRTCSCSKIASVAYAYEFGIIFKVVDLMNIYISLQIQQTNHKIKLE